MTGNPLAALYPNTSPLKWKYDAVLFKRREDQREVIWKWRRALILAVKCSEIELPNVFPSFRGIIFHGALYYIVSYMKFLDILLHFLFPSVGAME